MHGGFLFSTSSPALAISSLFGNSHSNRCEMISQYGFDLHPLMISDVLVMLSFFSCACWPSVRLLWKNFYSDTLPIFKLDCFVFSLLSCECSLYLLDISFLTSAHIFSFSLVCLFSFLMLSFEGEEFLILMKFSVLLSCVLFGLYFWSILLVPYLQRL